MAVDKIAVIKTGWSDDFTGSPVEADHQHVREFEDGGEKFNFLPGPSGRYYAQVPPIGETFAPPRPKVLTNWLVFCVAKKPGRRGLYLRGWYEAADFTGRYVERPEYAIGSSGFPLDEHGNRYHYVLSAPRAVALDPRVTPHVFPGDRMKRAPVFYLRGNDAKGQWRSDLARQLLAIRQRHGAGLDGDQSPIAGNGKGGICGDAEKRKEVETAAINLVKKHFPEPRYKLDDHQKRNLGYDLLVLDTRSNETMHVEVKGTQNRAPHFFMSRKEYGFMQMNAETWRLAMVTEALSHSKKLEILTRAEARRRFAWEEFTWHASGD